MDSAARARSAGPEQSSAGDERRAALEDVSFAYAASAPVLGEESSRRRPRRGRRARRAERVGQDDARQARGRAARARRRARRALGPRVLPEPGSRPLPRRASGPTRRSRSRPAATSSGRGGRSRAWGSRASRHRHPRDLSSGERERLAIAAVLVAEPDLLVLDEPTRGVDPERKVELAALLRAQAPAEGRSSSRTTASSRVRLPTASSRSAPERERVLV